MLSAVDIVVHESERGQLRPKNAQRLLATMRWGWAWA